MQLRGIISGWLILVVLLSSTECLSFVAFPCKPGQEQGAKLLFEKSNDLKQEFCEAFKLNLPEETRSDADVIPHRPPVYCFNAFQRLQFSCYQREFLSRKPSQKLFIDFGALII